MNQCNFVSFGDVGFLGKLSLLIFIFSELESVVVTAGDCDIIIEVNLDKIKIRDLF